MSSILLFFFFNDTATTEIYTLSLHDALPISHSPCSVAGSSSTSRNPSTSRVRPRARSEEHTSELQSPCNLVCRLLLEKKKNRPNRYLLCIYSAATVLKIRQAAAFQHYLRVTQ